MKPEQAVERLGQIEVPVPYSRDLEGVTFPDEQLVVEKIRRMLA